MTLAFELAWDPQIRAILVVALAVLVLPGSIYLILGTNLGARLGFLVAMAGVFGWMTIMAIIWAVYGIGYVGDSPSWELREVARSDDPQQLTSAVVEDARDLSTWNKLPADDPKRGEAQATASAGIAGDNAPLKTFEAESDYIVVDAYDKGGRGSSWFDQNIPFSHPPHYAIVQVQKVKEVDVPFGETPPKAEADPSAPVISVILERDLGDKRLPPVLVAIGSAIIFGVTCNLLHRRDKAVMAARLAAATS